jgi:hypothetical protein
MDAGSIEANISVNGLEHAKVFSDDSFGGARFERKPFRTNRSVGAAMSSGQLLPSNIWLDQNAGPVVLGHSYHLPAAQAAVSTRRFIVTFSESERILSPCQ